MQNSFNFHLLFPAPAPHLIESLLPPPKTRLVQDPSKKPKRTKPRNPSSWKTIENKFKRMTGSEYIGFEQQLITPIISQDSDEIPELKTKQVSKLHILDKDA